MSHNARRLVVVLCVTIVAGFGAIAEGIAFGEPVVAAVAGFWTGFVAACLIVVVALERGAAHG